MSIFYVGLNPSYQYFSWLPEGINVMYSAAGFWNLDARRWRRIRYIKQAGLKFLDPGGFTLLNKYDDYPFTIDEFLNLVAFLKPDYFATPDYPCEPDISRSLGLQSNLERVKKTVNNAAIMKRDLGMVGCGSYVPVFGLKLSLALYDLAPIIYSRDSAVALDSYDPKLREKRGGRRWPRGKKEKQEAFRSFFSRLERLGLKYRM